MTIDKLAIAIQKDFNAVHVELADIRTDMAAMHTDMAGMRSEMAGMVTKEELKSVESKILSAIDELHKITEGIGNKFTAYAERTNEIDVRLRVVEKRA